jgi:hypothetical protein
LAVYAYRVETDKALQSCLGTVQISHKDKQSSDIAGLIYRTGLTTTELNLLQSRVQMGRAKSSH